MRLISVRAHRAQRILGHNADPEFWIADDFDAPMADQAALYGKPVEPPTARTQRSR